MKSVLQIPTVVFLTCLPPACTSPGIHPPPPGGDVLAADITQESYYLPFWGEKAEEKTRLFTFRSGTDSYTLIDNGTGRTIRRNIYYQKTFGGAFPNVRIEVINSRFIVFPETIRGSEVPDELFCDMKAVTRIFDLKRHRLLPTAAAYQYNHNVPLKYDMDRLLRQIREEPSP